ncbi:hypothetical protein Micbo1qcDRAFT_141315 [Microdochium bolleyi]|uniref:Xylanolytic transcriptional activator regulatory domain-containing protein n=1 Tax=Microdochium bolleyi TaxID=196109 RepID=A0A136IKY5_9PEZI|nr:hypothetical protein Micbo1qcDRAFT_141315 [Microdochium bolleyi]
MHDKAHGLFHEASFRDRVARGTASRGVLMAMGGLCARFSPRPQSRRRGPEFAAAAKKALGEDIGRITLENAQTALLLVHVATGECDPDAASIYFVVASRMVQILKLRDGSDDDDAVTRETKLRIWWSCFILDTWSSRGANIRRQFMADHGPEGRPRLPMEESVFSSLKPGDPEPADRGRGLWACVVELIEIYTHIQDFHLDLATSEIWDDEAIATIVAAFEARMRVLEDSLAPSMSYTPANLGRYISRGLGDAFLAFHLGLNHYYTLLYYLYLDQRRVHKTHSVSTITSRGQAYAEKCKHYATQVSDILHTARQRDGCALVYNIVSHVTVVSSSVLLHTYLFGDVGDLPAAKDRLQSNFETLVLLRQYWPSVELMTKRLVIFQDNCLRSLSREDTYRFDRWMMRFLLEHWLALEDKAVTSAEVQSPGYVEPGSVDQVHFQRSKVTNEIITGMPDMEQ